MPKKIISSAIALSIACGTSVCVSALNVQDIKDNAKQSAQNVIQNIYSRLPDSTSQNWKTVLQLLKNKSEKYSYKNVAEMTGISVATLARYRRKKKEEAVWEQFSE